MDHSGIDVHKRESPIYVLAEGVRSSSNNSIMPVFFRRKMKFDHGRRVREEGVGQRSRTARTGKPLYS